MRVIKLKIANGNLNKKIGKINNFISQHSTICDIPGFRKLIEEINRRGQELKSGLNFVAAVIKLFENSHVSIDKVNVQRKPKGKNPDIVFKYGNVGYVSEIKTILENELDETLSHPLHQIEVNASFSLPRTELCKVCEVPYEMPNGTLNISTKLADVFKKLIVFSGLASPPNYIFPRNNRIADNGFVAFLEKVDFKSLQ